MAKEKPNKRNGRPPIFDSAKELEDKINAYFNGGANVREIIIGKGEAQQVIKTPLITITGLCYYLGFESRQSFYDYEKNGNFSYIIKKARIRVEQHYEELLQLNTCGPAGPIFVLKNMDWKDKNETNLLNNGDSFEPPTIQFVNGNKSK